MRPEEKFQQYFPGKEIPDRAFQEIKFFDEDKYKVDHAVTIRRPVSLCKIVGTIHPKYSEKEKRDRWIDMLVEGKKINYSHFKPSKIDTILAPESLKNLLLVHVPADNEFYIYGDGNHRISFNILSDKDFIEIDTLNATLKPVKVLNLAVSQPRKELTLLEKTGNWIKSIFG